MLSPRWRKIARDLWTERGRSALMIAAITVSLAAVGTMLGAYAVLTREIAASYQGTRPASATLELPDGVDAELVARVRQHPLVTEAEAREVVVARVRVGDDWRRLLLFVVDDFAALRLNLFRRVEGAWPPPTGTMLVERSAIAMLGAGPGERVLAKTPHGQARALLISGVVHDPGLAPAWQERSGYGYITLATVEALGERALLTELRIELAGRPTDPRSIEAQTAELARWLAGQGHPVHELRIPPPAQHPHQRQMITMLLMMLGFSVLALVLSAILVANSLAAMLARQVREIGVMKTVGACTTQIAGLYAGLVGVLGLGAVLLATPAGIVGALALTRAISKMLNFDLASRAIPAWVFAVQAAAGLLVPVVLAAIPILRASRTSVRQALDDHGGGTDRLRARFAFLPAPLRNALRRPARLGLTLGLLSAGGAMFMTAFNVKNGWEANVAKVFQTRSYDVEVRLQEAEAVALADRLRRLPDVGVVEPWGLSPAAFARPGQIDIVRTHPDKGHGSLVVMGPPAATTLVRFPVLAGRWLLPADGDAVVLNHVALAHVPHVRVGDTVSLSVDGRLTRWQVVGIVEEIGSPGVAYVTDHAFAAVSGSEGRARMLRVATRAREPQARAAAIRTIERDLAEAGVGVESAIPLAELRTAVGDHILILIRSLIAMAVILAIVGTLGLGSAMGVSVVERTRELGIMKTIGATPARIVRMLVGEGTAIGALSFVGAFLLSIPLTCFVDLLVGNLGFLAPLPLVLSTFAAVIWLALVVVVAALATFVPARQASARPIREALATT